VNGNILQHRFLLVGKGNVLKRHLAAHIFDFQGVRLVAHARLGVQQIKNTLGRRERGLGHRPHLRHGLDWPEEVLHILQEGHHGAHAGRSADDHRAAHRGHQRQIERADHFGGGREGRCDGGGVDVGIAVGGVALRKAAYILVRAIESLRHFHRAQFFLQLRRNIPNGCARAPESAARPGGEQPCDQQQNRHHHQHRQPQLPVEQQHRHQNPGQRKQRADHLRQPLADERVERFDVIYQAAHQVTGLLAFQVLQRKHLDLVEHLLAKVGQHTLTDRRHDVNLVTCGKCAGSIG